LIFGQSNFLEETVPKLVRFFYDDGDGRFSKDRGAVARAMENMLALCCATALEGWRKSSKPTALLLQPRDAFARRLQWDHDVTKK
jgi:hypothetical protein